MAELKNFYVQNLEGWQKTLSRGKLSDKELEVKVVERGIVLPARLMEGKNTGYEGGVCDDNFNFIGGFARYDPSDNRVGGGVDL